MTRWEGPVARDCQYLFVSDWMGEGGDDISALLIEPGRRPTGCGTIIAQVIGTGPTIRFDAMPSCFAELIHSAREELVITTPYFVPDEQVLFGADLGRPARGRHDPGPAQAQRQPDRRGDQPQLLSATCSRPA